MDTKNISVETNHVRVIGNTDPDKVKNDMIGQVVEKYGVDVTNIKIKK